MSIAAFCTSSTSFWMRSIIYSCFWHNSTISSKFFSTTNQINLRLPYCQQYSSFCQLSRCQRSEDSFDCSIYLLFDVYCCQLNWIKTQMRENYAQPVNWHFFRPVSPYNWIKYFWLFLTENPKGKITLRLKSEKIRFI